MTVHAHHRVAVRKQLAEKLLLLRRDNVKRHQRVVARDTLKESQVNKQRVREAQMEHDRLMGGISQGSGLVQLHAERLSQLSKLIGSNK